jgi:hypothetical protein
MIERLRVVGLQFELDPEIIMCQEQQAGRKKHRDFRYF